MFHLFLIASAPNFPSYHFLVVPAVTLRLLATKSKPHSSVVLHRAPFGAPATAMDKYKRHSKK